MSKLSQLDTLLFGFSIPSAEELFELLETVCIIGGFNRLIAFHNQDGFITIDYLDQECIKRRIQLKSDSFGGAKIDGRNQNGRRVSYVKEAVVLSVKIVENDGTEDGATHLFEADIDPDKIYMIANFIR